MPPTGRPGRSPLGRGDQADSRPVSYGPNNADCHLFAVMFIDPLDPAGLHEAAFATQRTEDGWMYDYWQAIGTGSFSLRFSGIDS